MKEIENNLKSSKNKGNKVVDFWDKHKEGIICSIVTGTVSVIICHDICQKTKSKYIAEKKIDDEINNQLRSKIDEMKEKMKEQYSRIKTLAGSGTQAGSSKCARALRNIA